MAEYAVWLVSTGLRARRDFVSGRPRGRSVEIQRLIGRSLRAALDRARLGPRTIWIDCDVLQADGGTRTASITGGWVALALAVARLERRGIVPPGVLVRQIAAVSVGIVGDEVAVDLCYEQDSRADVDLNVVMTAEGDLIEVQGTAERNPFDRDRLDAMLDAAWAAIGMIARAQRRAVEQGLARLDALDADAG